MATTVSVTHVLIELRRECIGLGIKPGTGTVGTYLHHITGSNQQVLYDLPLYF